MRLIYTFLFVFLVSGLGSGGSPGATAEAKKSSKKSKNRRAAKKTTRKKKSKKRTRKRRPRFEKYKIARGETLKQVSNALSVSIKDLKKWNRIRGSRVKTGRVLKYQGSVPKSESIGQTNRGRQRGARSIDADGDLKGVGFHVGKWRKHIWGTPELVKLIKRCGKYYREKVSPKRGHAIAIGDLSSRHGGPLPPHVSHQSGRDVDIGFIRKKPPPPGGFINTRPKGMNLYANWVVIKCFLDDPQTSMIFIEHSLVKALRGEVMRIYKTRRAKRERYLSFFPGGRRRVIYGDNDHRSHMHVRIRCPRGDKKCVNR